MKPITISLPAKTAQPYHIWIGSELLSSLTKYLPKGLACSSIVIITDQTVKKLYAVSLQKYLETAGFRSFVFSFPNGERYKTAKTKAALEQKMFQKQCDRNTLILALGGGVSGDLAGFVAATYMRGIAYLQIPTSLLAMIDSSVGGKTGINTSSGKNLIGAFWQPKAVIADLSLLRSLPQKHLRNGLFEAVKIFLTCNQIFFNDFKKNLPLLLNRDVKILTRIVQRAVQLKAEIVCQDEQEQNLRMILNFGHTIGHAIEQLSEYKMLHGLAVGLGMLVEAKIAELLGLLSHAVFEQIFIVLTDLGIEVTDLKKFSVAKIIQLTQLDKKTKQQQVKYVLLNAIGSVTHSNNQYAHPVPNQVVREALLILQQNKKL